MTDQLAADGVDDTSPTREQVDAPEAATGAEGVDDGLEPADASAASGRRRRVNRWDRPPQPRDWRFYVGGTGKVLIALGLLVFGFVAYQLWGTGIETARAQNQLENEFEVLLAEFDDADATSPAADGPDAADDPDTVDTPADAAPAADLDADAADGDDAAETNDPAVRPDDEAGDDAAGDDAAGETAGDTASGAIPVAVDLAEQAVVQDPIPQPFRGDPLLRLEIPEIGRDDIVVPGVALEDLKDGPGHYPDTPLPGQLGNAAIAGHRTTYGAPFFDVDQLDPGDEIITTLLNGDRFVYEVTSVEVVEATDYWVVATTNPSIAELTLTSCHPKYTARDRIVVHSVLNPAKSSNVGVPTFYTLDAAADDAPIPGDDPVLTAPAAEEAPDVVTDAVTDDVTEVIGSDEIEITPPADASGATPDPPAQVDDGVADRSETESAGADSESAASQSDADPAAEAAATPIDAFEKSWFDDTAAFPQIALWTLVLALIAAVAYQVAKRFRRVWVGVTLGVLPFLVALYFFYQNLNRLLPAGI